MGNYMYPSTPRKQQGISLSGLLIWSFVLILVSIVGMKLIPVYIENATIKRTLLAVATESNFKTNNEEIRQSFTRRASIDNIKAINGQDIIIDKKSDKVVLSTNYSVKIPLLANVSLYIDFTAASNQ
ncbi:MAG: DUF4845 domain-containing protein [Nitrosomonas sp.]|mgnify:CR=1 FL=1|nr:DUF4845 domain-containing protein [Nitrosomonas sp.]MBK7364612.1 DUF4845 domain-containing protein [Nitrosomonas sp.]